MKKDYLMTDEAVEAFLDKVEVPGVIDTLLKMNIDLDKWRTGKLSVAKKKRVQFAMDQIQCKLELLSMTVKNSAVASNVRKNLETFFSDYKGDNIAGEVQTIKFDFLNDSGHKLGGE